MIDPRIDSARGKPDGPSPTVSSTVLAIASIIPLALVMFGFLTEPEYLPIALNWALCCLGLASMTSRGPLDKTHPMFWGISALLLMYVIHPYAMVAGGRIDQLYHGAFFIRSSYSEALWLSSLATFAFIFGSILAFLLRNRPPLAPPPLSSETTDTFARMARRTGLTLLAFSVIGYSIFAIQTGENPVSAFLNGARRGTNVNSSAYLYMSPQLSGPAALLLLYANHLQERRQTVVVLILTCQVAIFFPSGQRLALLTILVPVLMMWMHLHDKRMPAGRFGVLSVSMLSILISLRDVGGGLGSTNLFDSLIATLTSPGLALEEFSTGPDTEMIDGFAVAVQAIPEKVAHDPGATLLATIAGPIPSAIWQGKPVTADQVLNYELLGIQKNNASVAYGFLGELYYDSSWLGIALGMSCFGFAAYLLYARFKAVPSLEFSLVYFALLPLTVSLMRGSLALILGRGLFTAAPLVLFFVWTVYERRRGAAGGRTPSGWPLEEPGQKSRYPRIVGSGRSANKYRA